MDSKSGGISILIILFWGVLAWSFFSGDDSDEVKDVESKKEKTIISEVDQELIKNSLNETIEKFKESIDVMKGNISDAKENIRDSIDNFRDNVDEKRKVISKSEESTEDYPKKIEEKKVENVKSEKPKSNDRYGNPDDVYGKKKSVW